MNWVVCTQDVERDLQNRKEANSKPKGLTETQRWGIEHEQEKDFEFKFGTP